MARVYGIKKGLAENGVDDIIMLDTVILIQDFFSRPVIWQDRTVPHSCGTKVRPSGIVW